jgi:hypothetical protein
MLNRVWIPYWFRNMTVVILIVLTTPTIVCCTHQQSEIASIDCRLHTNILQVIVQSIIMADNSKILLDTVLGILNILIIVLTLR